MSQDGAELIICDGGLASLVACAMAAKRGECRGEPTTTIAWFVPTGDETDPARRDAVRAASSMLSIAFGEGTVPDGESDGERETRALLHSASQAIRNGVQTIIWSIQIGGPEAEDWPELDAFSSRMDRALLCARLASLDAADTAEVRIETPLIDLTDRQLGELAADLSVGVQTCWWWGSGVEGVGLAGTEFRRWKPLLESAGLAAVGVV